MNSGPPILMIALDALEVTLMEQLCQQGKLPTLQSLREQGCFGTLESSAQLFSGGVWNTFYTSKEVPWHGVYHNKCWRHERMRCEVVTDKWLCEKPFWRSLDKDGFRIALVDVPNNIEVPKPINGVHLSAWASHESTVKGAWPASLRKQLKKRFGPPIMNHEVYRPQDWKLLLGTRKLLLDSTDQIVNIGKFILDQGPWNLFFIGLGASHRGGHLLWDLSQIDEDEPSPEIRDILSNALVDIYQACDQGVARLIEKAPPESRILVFAVHGMGQDPGWSGHIPEILSAIQRANRNADLKTGLLYRLRQKLPWRVVEQLSERLPQDVLNWAVTVWSAHMFDWSTIRYFPLLMDDAGFLRINLRGREPQGIVEPGEEYDTICKELSEAFLSFRDIATNEPIVAGVYRSDELAPPGAPYRDRLPDLTIQWGDLSAIHSSGIRSDKYGEIRWNTDGKLRSGRSGSHKRQGWFISTGDGIRAGSCANHHRTIDLVPTIFEWLSAERPEDFQGSPMSELC